MLLSRRWSAFLTLVGLWTWFIWPRFAAAIWADPRSWVDGDRGGDPTSFLVVHALLIVVSLTVGSVVGWLGLRGLLAGRRTGPSVAGGQADGPPAAGDQADEEPSATRRTD